MKHNISFLIFGSLTLFILGACSAPTGSTFGAGQPQATLPSCMTEEDGCDGGDDDFLSLQLTSTNDLTVSRDSLETGFQIQVKGVCDDGEFQDNRIQWYVVDAATSQVIGYSTGNYKEKCRSGKFQFFIEVLPGSMAEQMDYFLEVELIGIDDNLGDHTNELSASQTISIHTI